MKGVRLLAAMMVLGAAVLFFASAVWAAVASREFERRVEWAQLKIAALLPHPPQPEFVPTPLTASLVEATPPDASHLHLRAVQVSRHSESTPPLRTMPDAVSTATIAVTPTPLWTPTRGATRLVPRATLMQTPTPNPLPRRVLLTGFRHDYQRFNNCGPATLAILLSHFGRSETQYELAPILKGSPDDKNVSPEELAAYARSLGYRAIVRVNGDVARMKNFVAHGIPVLVENWFIPRQKEPSGHYRLLVGYDDEGSAPTRGIGLSVIFDEDYPESERGFFMAQDSYNGPNVKLPYRAWDRDWRVFNRTYVVIYADAQAPIVKAILGDDADDAVMYARARAVAQREIAVHENDAFAWFNLGSSLVGLSEYEQAAQAFDQARRLRLPWRMLWYQFGPYEAYYHTKRYEEVVALANATQANTTGVEESLYYRGLAQLALGQKDAARASFQRALAWNAHFARARQALAKMGN